MIVMPDREKVMTWLEICGENRECSGTCPYSENGFGEYGECRETLMTDALALLKEQEPVETELEGGGYNWWHVCGDCHGAIDQNDNYCKHCGRRIKHEKKAE